MKEKCRDTEIQVPVIVKYVIKSITNPEEDQVQVLPDRDQDRPHLPKLKGGPKTGTENCKVTTQEIPVVFEILETTEIPEVSEIEDMEETVLAKNI